MSDERGEPENQERLAELFAKLDAYITEKGLRSTTQRRIIAEAFFDAPSHITVEDLLNRVRGRDTRVGYATVYRTLKLLTECGIAAERHFGDGASRYELSDESTQHHHDHLICVACGIIVEFHDEDIEKRQDEIAKQHNFLVSSHRHEIYGRCPQCQLAKD